MFNLTCNLTINVVMWKLLFSWNLQVEKCEWMNFPCTWKILFYRIKIFNPFCSLFLPLFSDNFPSKTFCEILTFFAIIYIWFYCGVSLGLLGGYLCFISFLSFDPPVQIVWQYKNTLLLMKIAIKCFSLSYSVIP